MLIGLEVTIIGILLLKELSKVIEDKDEVYGIIKLSLVWDINILVIDKKIFD